MVNINEKMENMAAIYKTFRNTFVHERIQELNEYHTIIQVRMGTEF